MTIYQGNNHWRVYAIIIIITSGVTGQPASPVTYSLTLSDIDLSESTLSPQQQQQLLALLCDYSDLFATNNGPLGRTSIVKYSIHTEGYLIHQPVNCQPKALEDDIDTELEWGMESEWSHSTKF